MAMRPCEKNEETLVSMSLGDHLEELRMRLILALVGFAAAFFVSLALGKLFLRLILWPYQAAMQALNMPIAMQAIDVAEPFMVYLKASMVLAFLVSSPWVFYQIWAFVAAGLYSYERRFVKLVAPASAALFVAGVMLFLLVVAPLVFQFLVRFNPGVEYLSYNPKITNTVNFILILSLVFGIAFQTPIAIVFAWRMGLVSLDQMVKARKYLLLASFVIGAVATPPDVVSQIALAVPLYLLFEASVLVCRVWQKRKKIV